MTEEPKAEEVKIDTSEIYSLEDIAEMFDSGFLAKAQLIGSRLKKTRFPDKKIAYFMVRMSLEFPDQEEPLQHAPLKEKLNLQLQAVLQEDLDKAAAQKKAEQEKLNDQGSSDSVVAPA